LESVTEYVSLKSQLGGEVFLNLAMTLEVCGRNEEAKELYAELRKSPIAYYAQKAKQLSFGFKAMEDLRVDSTREVLKVMDFELPDVAALSTRNRYDTSYFDFASKREAEIRSKLNLDKDTKAQKRVNNAIFLIFISVVTVVLLNFIIRIR